MPQQGRYLLRLSSADGKPLDFGKADHPDKLLEFSIPFPTPFAAAPLVFISVLGLDCIGDYSTNWKPDVGFDLTTPDIQPNGFTVHARVSLYNRAFKVFINWLALDA